MDQTVLDFQSLRDALQGRLSSLQGPTLLNGAQPGSEAVRAKMPFHPGLLTPDGIRQLSPAMRWLIGKESGGRTSAKNPKSTAFGVGQLLLANRQKYLGNDYNTTDYAKQLDAMRRYIGDRYGTAEKAMAFHQQHGWY